MQNSITLTISPPLSERLSLLAQTRQSNVEEMAQEALEAFVARQEEREELRRACDEAWEDYKKTGLHLTNDEVIAWMDKIIAGEKAPMPPCHT